MQNKLHIKKGDIVYVNAGENKGQQGRVLEVIRKSNKAIVEGINLVSRHTKPNAKSPQGGIHKKEAPVHISNLMLFCNKCNKTTRIGYTSLKDGTRVRKCRRCLEVLG